MINKLISPIDENNEFSDLVDILNEYIRQNKQKEIRILEKNVIIFLVTKMETFLEKKTVEWLENQKKANKTVYDLPDVAKKEIIKNTTEVVYDEIKEGYISANNKNKLYNFNLLLDEYFPIEKLDFDFRITLKSHGSNEIKRLLKKIGIEDIFQEIDKIESTYELEEIESIHLKTKIEYEGNINKLVKYRNDIIHEDMLNSISYADLNAFIRSVNVLGKTILTYLGENFTENQNEKEIVLFS